MLFYIPPTISGGISVSSAIHKYKAIQQVTFPGHEN